MNIFMYTCVLWLLYIGFKGAVGYGECVVFCGNGKVPNATDVMFACIKKGDCSYCRFAPNCCPDQLSCNTPISSPDERCLVCPGEECVYDGNSYPPKETFDSIDGTNTCTCKTGGSVTCTEESLPSSVSEFCN
ncbi:uncharacterized protein LOC110453483 [Mizuhopecten yessoensis]|uniref:Uncharacterized protein n=1 Tax=Mizuhopecten yessoensis TaxID=6573 RepID=A0A210QHG4_MIZYE|nr:uncharacterized protein LOC110453483 [Mizuhopecten yessoensis]OWF48126.1 hypothetical protein KP79_PYT24714 [Mizuhopecten yessoensis]